MDVYVWESNPDGDPAPGPDPGNLICMIAGVDPGPPALWPARAASIVLRAAGKSRFNCLTSSEQGRAASIVLRAYGAGEESWLIAFSQFHGDPGREQVWLDLDRFLRQEFTHESGQKVPITCVTVDSGSHHSEQVYRFCKARVARRVFAVRGGAERGKPVVGRPSEHNRYRTKLFTLCVDTAKEIVFSRLRIGGPGPGYCHLPEWIDVEYVAQLTAEKAVRRWVKNRGTVREWIKTRERNEALDLEVYSLAALYILGPTFVRSLPERAAALARKSEATGTAEPTPTSPPPRRRGWVDGWRG